MVIEKNLYKTMLRKPPPHKTSPQFVKFREKSTLVRYEPNFCQLVILIFFYQISYEKVWDTLIALNFIVVIAKTALKIFGFLAWGIQTPPWSE